MNIQELNEIRRIAELKIADADNGEEDWYLEEDMKAGFYVQPQDYDFVALVSPKKVLELLDEIEAVRKANRYCVDEFNMLKSDYDKLKKSTPDLDPVINWLENGCDVSDTVVELKLYDLKMKSANE